MFSLGFRLHQASPVSFSDHQASPWSSRTLSAHQVSPVTISVSSHTISALQAPSVSISASPRSHTISQDSVGLGCSSSTARPRSRHLGCPSCSASSRWLSIPFGTPALCLDLWVSHRQWVSVAPQAPPGLAGDFLPLVALGLHSWFGYRVSALLLLLFRLFFLLLVKYYSLFCLICKLGYLLSICCTILATAWLFWVILLLFFYYG